MLYKKLSLIVVLALIAAAAIFGLRSWVASDAPQSAPAEATTTVPATSAPAVDTNCYSDALPET